MCCEQVPASRWMRNLHAQVGSWSGVIAIDGEEISVSLTCGSAVTTGGGYPADRRPEPAGRPAHPPFEGMWWLYVPMAFDDFAICLIIPGGAQRVSQPDVTRIWRDGRVEQMGWPRVQDPLHPGHPHSDRRNHRGDRARRYGRPLRRGVPSCRCRFTSAAATAATSTGTARGHMEGRTSPSASPIQPTRPSSGRRLRRHRPRRPRRLHRGRQVRRRLGPVRTRCARAARPYHSRTG